MTDKERKSLEEAGLLYPAPNCVDYNQKVQVIAKEMADRIWKAINDKVQVVRCKDCKWSDCDGRCIRNRLYRHSPITLEPESYFRKVEPDDFCSWGERREDNA